METLWNDIQEYGVEPEHMDRLARYARDLGVPGVQDFEDYFEQWGVSSDMFESMYIKCTNRIRANALGLPRDITEYITQFM